jgi:hypothetical protein
MTYAQLLAAWNKAQDLREEIEDLQKFRYRKVGDFAEQCLREDHQSQLQKEFNSEIDWNSL